VTTATLTVTTGTGTAAGPITTVVNSRAPFVIGRALEADLVIDDVRVSRRHLVIEADDQGWQIHDASSNGSWFNGAQLGAGGLLMRQAGTARLFLGDAAGPEVAITFQAPAVAETIRPVADRQLGHGTVLRRREDLTPSDPNRSMGVSGTRLQHQQQAAHELAVGRITVGRDPASDVHLPDLLVSRNHAELRIAHNEAEIVDLGSANGTFVNGQRVIQAPVYDGDVITIGHYLLQVEGGRLVEFVDTGDITFEAQDLAVFAGQKQLMHEVSFQLPARSLLAVVGPSGAGKSTLLNALTGFRPADSGTVWYAGRDLYASYDELRRRIGYVPQEDLLHTTLSVRKALEFGAQLRFPPDVTEAERTARVDEVLAELGLTQHANTQVARLSGGQRKRTSVALELLTKPSLLYLDEPTSGLDPGLDKSVMQSLRTLADDGRTVVVVTHSVANLDTCDFVLMLAPGGYVAYFGPPGEALAYFGKTDFADVFLALEATPGAEWGERFRASKLYRPPAGGPENGRVPDELSNIRQQPVRKQLTTLVRRYLSVVMSDKSYTRLIIAFPLLLGIIPRVVPAKNGLRAFSDQPNQDAPTVLLVLILCACFMGMANSVREIVKERPIYRRERSIGLSMTAYLGSKIVVLTIITALQALVFTLIGVLGRTPSKGVVLGSSLLEVVIAVIITAVVSMLLGLVISALVDNADKTMPLLVLITMAQLVLSGGLVPLVGKPGLEQVAWFAPARWGAAAVGSSIDLNRVVMAGNKQFKAPPHDPVWDHTASTYLTDLGLCVVVGIGCVVLCAFLLRRGDPKPARGRK
jgi:ABC-type multidrug transport system ATPase subunit/pSer/pThr/pTyr-binding forkhead associated (FHA) protein/ABC-type multidrug transport system permease subunit